MPDTPPDKNQERFDQNLAFYVSGSLDPLEAAWMAAWVDSHPECQNDLLLTKQIRQVMQDTQSHKPANLRERLLLEALGMPARPKHTWVHLKDKAVAGLQSRWLVPVPLVAFATILLLVQSTWLLLGPMLDGDDVLYRSTQSDNQNCVNNPIRVVFTPEAKFEDVVLVLRSIQVEVVSGPNSSGAFWVRPTRAGSTAEALAALTSHKLVEEVVTATDTDAAPCQR